MLVAVDAVTMYCSVTHLSLTLDELDSKAGLSRWYAPDDAGWFLLQYRARFTVPWKPDLSIVGSKIDGVQDFDQRE